MDRRLFHARQFSGAGRLFSSRVLIGLLLILFLFVVIGQNDYCGFNIKKSL